MADVNKILARMRTAPSGIRYADLTTVCRHYFGDPRQQSGSHAVYRMPWAGDPRVDIQRGVGGKAKTYQVKQVLQAVERLQG